MITKNIKATNIELTEAINNYVDKRLESLKKFTKGNEIIVYVEVGKTTNHHKSGDVYKAEFNMEISGNKYYSVSEQDNLYKAIDDSKEELVRQIKNNKGREKTLFKRGATSVKKMLKGISKRNPFTSKY
jgi:ribosomal subunit interface protein